MMFLFNMIHQCIETEKQKSGQRVIFNIKVEF